MSASITVHNAEQSGLPRLETTPVRFKTILAATDLSERATSALKIAARMAKQFRSTLHVVHAVTPEFYMADATMLSSELQKIDVERCQRELHEYTRRIPEVRATLHEETAICGAPTDVITSVVEAAGIDLLVMGSHGRGPVGKLVLGSVAEAVIRRTHCPVLVVGPHCGGRLYPLRSIVLGMDLPAASLRAAQYATSLARQFGSTLMVVRVLAQHSRPISGAVEERFAKEDLRELAPGDPELRKHIHFQIRSGEAAEEILRIAAESKANLIVMGAREHSTLADHAPWATLSRVIRGAHCPVLAVQPHSV
ncbi:MAG TPA: universal stress protein [Silvibacterium sp.]|nr:universal stress protein [Silvibacterium sp.]